MEKSTSTSIPIAFKSADRELLQAAAELLGKPLSTVIRESSVEVARQLLEPPAPA